MASDKKQASAEHQSGGVGAQDQRQQRQPRREVKNQELDQEQEFPLMRQTSLYSLTLDEIQNTVCEPGKTFGSMNMDEFLANIWSAEEGPAAPDNAADAGIAAAGGSHPPLHRQGSLTVPAPLCRKTVDEVWAEIHREHPVHHPYHGGARTAARQPTFGEMTLEDFLVKAGVVREGNPSCAATPLPPQPPPDAHNLSQQFGLPDFQMGPEAAAGFGHAVGPGYGDHQSLGGGANGVYQGGACYSGGGRMGNGYGAQQLGLVGSPMSPVSSDGLVGMQVESSGPYGGGAEVDGARGGRKRLADGTVEKVVERRQRRMIKNRESAARSRARKQAYTVELEAEINQLREENVQLKEEDQRVKHMVVQTMEEQSRARAMKARGTLHRCNSCDW